MNDILTDEFLDNLVKVSEEIGFNHGGLDYFVVYDFVTECYNRAGKRDKIPERLDPSDFL